MLPGATMSDPGTPPSRWRTKTSCASLRLSQGGHRSVKRHALTILALAVWIAAGAPSRSQDAPQPVPLIEREEVRLVTLDLVVEERDADSTKPGWRTCTLLSKD